MTFVHIEIFKGGVGTINIILLKTHMMNVTTEQMEAKLLIWTCENIYWKTKDTISESLFFAATSASSLFRLSIFWCLRWFINCGF